MGYPRFDKYFIPGFERNNLIEKFNCDSKKKTIVWLPTWTSLSSINKYHKVISSLRIDVFFQLPVPILNSFLEKNISLFT